MERGTRLGEVRDLGPTLQDLSRQAIEDVLGIARILVYQARMGDAIELLDSEVVRVLKSDLPTEVDVRIRLAKAECMILSAVFANAGHAPNAA